MNAHVTSEVSRFEFASHYDVVIVGAGIAGCACARALRKADPLGHRRILLIDLHHGPAPRFSGEFIHPRGARVLRDLGFEDALLRRGAVQAEGFVVRERPDSEAVVLDYASLTHVEDYLGMGIDHEALGSGLREVIAADPGIDFREGWRAVAISHDSNGVRGIQLRSMSKGVERAIEISTNLVIAADGKASPTRKLAGISDERRSLGFTAGIEFEIEKLWNPAHAHVLLGARGPMLCYAIEALASGSFRYRLTFDIPHQLPAKGDALRAHLLHSFLPHLPEPIASAALGALRNGKRVEMAPTIDLPAPQAHVPGLILVGDAAGCSHPVTASGMTMALLDAETLGVIAAERSRRAPKDQRWLDEASLRRFRVAHDRYVPTRQAVANAIYESFRGETEGARCIRQALFAYWRADPANCRRSLALLSCVESRPQVFVAEYLKAAHHAMLACTRPRYAEQLPFADRWWRLRGTSKMARDKFGVIAQVGWKQLRPAWWDGVEVLGERLTAGHWALRRGEHSGETRGAA